VRPKREVIVYCADEVRAGLICYVLQQDTRYKPIKSKNAYELKQSIADAGNNFGVVLLASDQGADAIAAQLDSDRVPYMMLVGEFSSQTRHDIGLRCARKRGPKKVNL
jgi:hypothetical protein